MSNAGSYIAALVVPRGDRKEILVPPELTAVGPSRSGRGTVNPHRPEVGTVRNKSYSEAKVHEICSARVRQERSLKKKNSLTPPTLPIPSRVISLATPRVRLPPASAPALSRCVRACVVCVCVFGFFSGGLFPGWFGRSHRAEELRNIYQEDIHYFVQHGSSLLKKLHKTRPASQNSEQVLKLVQYVKEGHNALLYINRCHDTGHVPSAASLQSLEHTLIRVHKASNALQVSKRGAEGGQQDRWGG